MSAAASSRHPHSHDHDHHTPHPAQTVGWSILRTSLAVRLAGAVAISAGLWAVIVLAMR